MTLPCSAVFVRGSCKLCVCKLCVGLLNCVYVLCRYPSLILPGTLYLGDWGNAEQQERLQELKIKR